MIEGLTVRPVRPGDEVTMQAYCKTGTTPDQVRRQVECTVRDARDGVMAHLVADLNGDVIGTAMLIADTAHLILPPDGSVELCPGRTDRPPTSGRFDDWVVYGKYWRQGVGRALFSACENLARSWGWATLSTSTAAGSNAELAFRSYGLTEWGRLPRGGDDVEVFFTESLDEPTSR